MPREITIQADLGGASIAFVTAFDVAENETDINDDLDMVMKIIGRQKSKTELSEKLLSLQVNKRLLDAIPEREAATRKDRAEERIRLRASFEADHNLRQVARARQTAFSMSKQQQQALDQHDEVTRRMIEGIAKEKSDYERDRPLIEMQISRLRAIIAGRDPNEAPLPEQEGAAAAA